MTLRLPPKGGGTVSATQPATSRDACLARHINLMEFLCSLSDGAAGKRECGTLQVTTRKGRWQLKLRCPNSKCYCFIVTDTLDEALEIANMGLESGELDWRPDTWEAGKGRK